MRYANVPDLLLIGLSAYVVLWGINGLMRHLSVPQLQA